MIKHDAKREMSKRGRKNINRLVEIFAKRENSERRREITNWKVEIVAKREREERREDDVIKRRVKRVTKREMERMRRDGATRGNNGTGGTEGGNNPSFRHSSFNNIINHEMNSFVIFILFISIFVEINVFSVIIYF